MCDDHGYLAFLLQSQISDAMHFEETANYVQAMLTMILANKKKDSPRSGSSVSLLCTYMSYEALSYLHVHVCNEMCRWSLYLHCTTSYDWGCIWGESCLSYSSAGGMYL